MTAKLQPMPPDATRLQAASSQEAGAFADPELVRVWMAGRALARGTPAPEPVGDGWCVHAGLPKERSRYVFPAPCTELEQLAQTVTRPLIFLKVCASADVVAHLWPTPWQVQRPGYLMETMLQGLQSRSTFDGYELAVEQDGPLLTAVVISADGAPAARGHAALLEDHAIFDRIETEEAHRRRGLGSQVMRALGNAAMDFGATRAALVATPEGRSLYTSLGWRLHTPFTTAVIPRDGHP